MEIILILYCLIKYQFLAWHRKVSGTSWNTKQSNVWWFSSFRLFLKSSQAFTLIMTSCWGFVLNGYITEEKSWHSISPRIWKCHSGSGQYMYINRWSNSDCHHTSPMLSNASVLKVLLKMQDLNNTSQLLQICLQENNITRLYQL